jgi:beta-1,4-mannosyltransferase
MIGTGITSFMFPARSDDNPYINQVRQAVEAEGVTVIGDDAFHIGWLREHQGPRRVVHFHWPEYHYNHPRREVMAARVEQWERRLRFARELGYGFVWTAHNIYPHDNFHPDLNHHGRQITARYATGIICHGSQAASEVRRLFAPRAPVAEIPHGHYLDAYPRPGDAGEARAALGLRPDSFVLLSIGRLRWYKGLKHLLTTFRALPAPDVELVIAGKPPNDVVEEKLRTLAAADRRVHVHCGHIEDGALPRYFAAANLVVLPYRVVTTSGSLNLAMSMGRGIIAPRLGCIPESVTASTGILYDPDAPDGLAGALTAAPRSDWPGMGVRAAQAMTAQSWDAIGAATAAVYQAALEKVPIPAPLLAAAAAG